MHIRQNKRNLLDPSVVNKEEEDDDTEWCEETEHETESETSSKSDDEIQTQQPDEEPSFPVTTSTKSSAASASLAEPSQTVTTTSSKQQQQQQQQDKSAPSSSYWVSSVCHKNKSNAKKNAKTKKSVAFCTNADGSVVCQTRLVSIHEQDDCWYRPEEKLAMQEHFSRVVLFYHNYAEDDDEENNEQLNSEQVNEDGEHGNTEKTKKNAADTSRRAFVEALAKLQKDAHKLTMPQTCQYLSTIALHTTQTRGLESYVLSDEFDYMRQKHLLRILMVQNQLEQQFGMYEERQSRGSCCCTKDDNTNINENNNQKEEEIDQVEDLIMNELSRTSLRWSVRSTQFARLIALLDKHAAQEALSSPWIPSSV
jgi:hypothetical protein